MIILVILLGSAAAFLPGCEWIGSKALSRLGFTDRCSRFALPAGVGVAILTLFLTILGAAGLYTKAILQVLWLAVSLAGLARLWRSLPNAAAARTETETGNGLALFVPRIGLVVVLALCLGTVMTPETRHDPYDYHLSVPTIYLAGGGIAEIPWHVFSYMPKNTEMLYGMALAAGNDSNAKLFHFGFGLLCLLALADIAMLAGGALFPWMAAFLTATLPLFGFIATSAYIDLALAFWELLALLCLLAAVETGARGRSAGRWLVLSAFFAGFALGTKYVSWLVFFPPYALFAGWALYRLAPGRRWLWIAAMAAACAVPVAPWLIFNWIWTGNPVYPLLPSIFGFQIPPAREAFAFFRGHAPPAESLGWPEIVPFIGMRLEKLLLDGNALILIGAAGIALTPLWRKSTAALRPQGWLHAFIILSSLLFLIGTDNHDGRFFFATIALLSIPGGQALTALHAHLSERAASGGLVLPVIALALFGNALTYRFSQLDDQRETLFPILSEELREDWLSNHFPYHPIIRWSNENLPENAVVFGMGYPLRRAFIARIKYGYLPFLDKPPGEYGPDGLIGALRKNGVTHILVPNGLVDIPDDPAGLPLTPVYQYRGKTLYRILE